MLRAAAEDPARGRAPYAGFNRIRFQGSFSTVVRPVSADFGAPGGKVKLEAGWMPEKPTPLIQAGRSGLS